MVHELETRIAAVVRVVANAKVRPKVFSVEGVNPLVIGGHWIPDILAIAGGIMTAHSAGCSAQRIAWEEILECAPDKLFIDLCSSDLDRNLREVPWMAAQKGWADLPAVQSGEVYLIDHVFFSRPGPRVVTGLEILAQLIHPNLFEGLVPLNTVLKLDPNLAAGRSIGRIGQSFRPYPGP